MDILSVVGSWGDTLSEQQVLAHLQEIARGGETIVDMFEELKSEL